MLIRYLRQCHALQVVDMQTLGDFITQYLPPTVAHEINHSPGFIVGATFRSQVTFLAHRMSVTVGMAVFFATLVVPDDQLPHVFAMFARQLVALMWYRHNGTMLIERKVAANADEVTKVRWLGYGDEFCGHLTRGQLATHMAANQKVINHMAAPDAIIFAIAVSV